MCVVRKLLLHIREVSLSNVVVDIGRLTDNVCDLFSLSRHSRYPSTIVRRSIRPAPRQQYHDTLYNEYFKHKYYHSGVYLTDDTENPNTNILHQLKHSYQPICPKYRTARSKQAEFSGNDKRKKTEPNNLQERNQ
jgi:hypothetical protein